MTIERKKMNADRRRLLVNLMFGGTVGLALTACGGGGSSSNEGSHDLRAALDRLRPGMTREQVIAAVGWEPNDGISSWDDGDEWLMVAVNSLDGSDTLIITGAHWHRFSENIERSYI